MVKFKNRRKLGKKQAGKLTAKARFGGNTALTAKSSKALSVRYGQKNHVVANHGPTGPLGVDLRQVVAGSRPRSDSQSATTEPACGDRGSAR